MTPRGAVAKFERRELLLPPPTWTTIRQLKAAVDRRGLRMGARPEDRPRHAGLHQGRDDDDAHVAGRPALSDHSRLGGAGGNAVRAGRRRAMATAESLTAAIDRVIELFNAKAMDLPDGFFDRRTQFVLNGSSFETLLGRPDERPARADARARARRLSVCRQGAATRHARRQARRNVVRRRLSSMARPLTVRPSCGCRERLRGTGETLNRY